MKTTLKKRIISKERFEPISAIVAVAIIYIIMESVGITCPIKFITGISCAGCGMSRAWLSLLHLDFISAFHFHPLFFLPPIALFIIIFKAKINPQLYKTLLLTIFTIFVIIYLYRLIFGNDDIVVFEPQNNIIFRIIRLLKKKKGVV